MGAIDYLREHGFNAKVKGNRLVVSPSSKLTLSVRQFIKLHRLELIAEVSANDGETRRSNWQINLRGKLITMIGVPMTYDEALTAARWRWSDADILEAQ